MKIVRILTIAALLAAPAISHADLLGLRAENRIQGGEYKAQTKGNNNVANAASINMTGSKAREVTNRVRATGTVSASATGNHNMVNSASVMMQNSQAGKVTNTVKVNSIGNTVRGNNNTSNIASVQMHNSKAGK
jgi:predicted nucleotidyltransferase